MPKRAGLGPARRPRASCRSNEIRSGKPMIREGETGVIHGRQMAAPGRRMQRSILAAAALPLLMAGWSAPAAAQEDEAAPAKEPRRIRVGLGAQFVPSYPGADDPSLRPL